MGANSISFGPCYDPVHPMTTSPSSPARRVSELINGFWATQVIHTAVALGLVDHIAEGAATVAELAERAEAHAPSVLRLLRAMQTLDLCRIRAGDRLELTRAGEVLRTAVAGSLRSRALFAGDMLWRQFGDLTHVVKTGGRSRGVGSGPEGFAQLAAAPARLDAFQTSMAEGSERAARGAVRVCDFGRFRTLLDLGGGYGGVLSVLLAAYPALRGAVCDLAYLREGATAYLERAGVADRGAFVAGDFFEAVPAGYDAIVMKFILHDWDDARARRILENCRSAAEPHCRVIVLEQVVPRRLGHGATDRDVMRADLTMMTVGGQERTALEYEALCASAGWRLTGITTVEGGFYLLEAAPA
jgi:O-methyltransferase domain/Dimerisation domain